ncbi:MAG: cardiolipin synthase [Lachnospiraceae bacterium]|nr:cardiolipin synthase [Lachnospiraceae bacterium]
MTVEKKDAVHNGVKRAVFAGIAIILQIAAMYIIFFKLESRFSIVSYLVTFLAVILVLGVYARHITAAMKMPWLILITALPFLGVFLYLMLGLNAGTRRMRHRYETLDKELYPLLPENKDVTERLSAKDEGVAGQSRYISDNAHYPVYDNTDVTFYDDGETGYRAQLEELKKAESFIFMEYHAIEDGKSFEPLHEILKEKAAAGLDVRLFYDYVGSMGFIGNSFVDRMERDGIKCRVFNPMNPVLNFFVNNRDHRKITVIDGRVGFTGGYNLADEYFHVTKPYGHWLDTGIRLEGDAVKSLTVTFLENWNAIRDDDKDDKDYARFLPDIPYEAEEKGFIQPYADSPLDYEHVGENVYMNVLRNARKYAWFITPYLIITDEMNSAFALAAKSGVDVRIITPGIPDKKIIYSVTRSYYAQLAMNGVRIFEYTPGFCHAKQCVSDDKVATCGTINLDFRSLYHHFENGAFMYDYKAVKDMKRMFDEVLPVCREVTGEYRTGRSQFLKLKQLILRLFAPLM